MFGLTIHIATTTGILPNPLNPLFTLPHSTAFIGIKHSHLIMHSDLSTSQGVASLGPQVA